MMGGLASALLPAVRKSGVVWFGSSGKLRDSADGAPPLVQLETYGRGTIATVDLPAQHYSGFYEGFANSALWPLLHAIGHTPLEPGLARDVCERAFDARQTHSLAAVLPDLAARERPEWREVALDWAMDRIAHLTKRTRDESFVARLPDGTRVNHTLAVASMGGATLDNEENYLIKKLFSAGLGMVFVENQARV